jgi:transposase-like protein
MINLNYIGLNGKEMNCKFCNSTRTVKYGFKASGQYYKCNDCRRTFAGILAPEGMRFTTATIGEALGLFFDGLSLSDISRHLIATDGIYVNPSTVWRWVIRYSKEAHKLLGEIKVKTSGRWVIDEMVVKIAGRNYWLWDVINADDRFLLASHLTTTRTMRSAIVLLYEAKDRTIGIPREIVTDGLGIYPDAVEQVFGADSKHIRAKGLTAEINTNIIERFQGTVKERTKVMRGLKTLDSAEIISDGFIIHYDFLRPHMTLKGKTPAMVAGLKLPFKTWIELVDYLWKKSNG